MVVERAGADTWQALPQMTEPDGVHPESERNQQSPAVARCGEGPRERRPLAMGPHVWRLARRSASPIASVYRSSACFEPRMVTRSARAVRLAPVRAVPVLISMPLHKRQPSWVSLPPLCLSCESHNGDSWPGAHKRPSRGKPSTLKIAVPDSTFLGLFPTPHLQLSEVRIMAAAGLLRSDAGIVGPRVTTRSQVELDESRPHGPPFGIALGGGIAINA